MSLVVNTNVGSLNAQRSLAASGAELKTAMERLSSGSKINSASDDAAGFAIAERMTAQIRGLNMAAKNAGDGLSMLSAIENATNDVTDMLQRMRELAVQAVNDTNTQQDREYLQQEVDGLLAEINRVASQTQYNGQTVLDGTYQNKSIQVGTDAGQTVSFSVAGIDTGALGLDGNYFANTGQIVYNGPQGADSFGASPDVEIQVGDVLAFSGDTSSSYTVTNTMYTADFPPGTFEHPDTVVTLDRALERDVTQESILKTSVAAIDLVNDASGALASISNAIEQVSGQRAEYGALQNRLEYTVSNLMNVSEFTTAARSRIADADFAAESARLAKAQVLQQSGTAMLAQANASSQLALSLIR